MHLLEPRVPAAHLEHAVDGHRTAQPEQQFRGAGVRVQGPDPLMAVDRLAGLGAERHRARPGSLADDVGDFAVKIDVLELEPAQL